MELFSKTMMNNWIGLTVKYVWNVMHNFSGFVVNTIAHRLDRIPPSSPSTFTNFTAPSFMTKIALCIKFLGEEATLL